MLQRRIDVFGSSGSTLRPKTVAAIGHKPIALTMPEALRVRDGPPKLKLSCVPP
jgi:hypothetical protein